MKWRLYLCSTLSKQVVKLPEEPSPVEMTSQEIEDERRRGRIAGIAALAGVIIFIVSMAALASDFNSAEQAEQLRIFDSVKGDLLLQVILQAVAVLMFLPALLSLFRSIRARSSAIRPGLIGIVIASPILLAASLIVTYFAFKAAADVHPRFQTPGRAIALQGAWATVLVLTGTYRELFTRVIYTEWIFFALLAIGIVVLRGRPGYAPQWRMPGVPLVPAAFAIVSFAIAVNQIRVDPVNSAIGLGIVLTGLPVYWLWGRTARATTRDLATS